MALPIENEDSSLKNNTTTVEIDNDNSELSLVDDCDSINDSFSGILSLTLTDSHSDEIKISTSSISNSTHMSEGSQQSHVHNGMLFLDRPFKRF